MEETPRRGMKVVMGDMNAKIGNDNKNYERVTGREGCGTMNENGERLIDLIVGGTLFTYRESHKMTWYSPNGTTKIRLTT